MNRIGLNTEKSNELAGLLSDLLANYSVFYQNARGYHWNLEGDKFSHACPFARIMENNLASRLVQIGIRTLSKHQKEQADKFGVEIIQMKDFSSQKLPEFENPVYLSLDIDFDKIPTRSKFLKSTFFFLNMALSERRNASDDFKNSLAFA